MQTESFTVDLMLAGVRDFPTQMGAAFNAEARFGTTGSSACGTTTPGRSTTRSASAKATPRSSATTTSGGCPQADDTFGGTAAADRYIRNRPVFPANSPGGLISPNLAGREAAALALCYQVYRTSDPAYANKCLLSAEHVFDLANTAPDRTTADRDPVQLLSRDRVARRPRTRRHGAQPRAGRRNTTRRVCRTPIPLFYLQSAATWANAYITGPERREPTRLNLYDVSGLAHYELANAITRAGNPAGLATTVAALTADLKKQLDNAVAQSATDPFGFGFPWATYDTTVHGAGLTVMAREYDHLTAHDHVRRLRRPMAGQHPGRQRLGPVADRR